MAAPNLNLKERIANYIRVLRVARKPTKDEFISTSKICSAGMLLIGVIGFAVFIVYILLGV